MHRCSIAFPSPSNRVEGDLPHAKYTVNCSSFHILFIPIGCAAKQDSRRIEGCTWHPSSSPHPAATSVRKSSSIVNYYPHQVLEYDRSAMTHCILRLDWPLLGAIDAEMGRACFAALG